MKNTSKPKASKNKSGKRREIDLVMMFKAVFKKLWLIALVAVVAGGMTFVGLKLFVSPTYRSSFTAFVNNTQEETVARTNSDIMASQALAKTYSQIITSRYVLGEAAKEMDMDDHYGSLKKMVSTTINDQTGIITVNVDTHSKELSYDLAQKIEKHSLQYTAKVIEGSAMKIIDHPFIPEGIFRPEYLKISILVALACALLTMLVICIRQFFNDKVHSDSDLAEHYTIPIVGVIPDIINAGKSSGDYYYYRKTPKTEDKEAENTKKAKIGKEGKL